MSGFSHQIGKKCAGEEDMENVEEEWAEIGRKSEELAKQVEGDVRLDMDLGDGHGR